jgi:hypothetical protein
VDLVYISSVSQRIILSPPERRTLLRQSKSRSVRAEQSKRAQLILRLTQGQTYLQIMEALNCSQNYIIRWKERFIENRLAGLYARHPGKNPQQIQQRLTPGY